MGPTQLCKEIKEIKHIKHRRDNSNPPYSTSTGSFVVPRTVCMTGMRGRMAWWGCTISLREMRYFICASHCTLASAKVRVRVRVKG